MSNEIKIEETKSKTYIAKRSVINTGIWVPIDSNGMNIKENKSEILGFVANDYHEGAKLHLTAVLDFNLNLKPRKTMNIIELAISKSTPEEITQLVRDLTEESNKYREAFYKAKAFIDSHAADPDITSEMVELYAEYQDALKKL